MSGKFIDLEGKAVPIRFWNRIRNSGDAITSFIVSRLFNGIPFYEQQSSPHVLASGSVLFMANSSSAIWGSGVLSPDMHLPNLAPAQIRAIRGRLSADFLVQKGVHIKDVPFGDPGIFAADLVRDRKHHIKYRIAVVPHHGSVEHPLFQQAARRDDVCVVNIFDNSLQPIIDIAQSEIVVSQSLHGLIYAESLNKPSIWISSRSDEIWNFKFADWFSTAHNPQTAPVPMDGDLDAIAARAEFRFSSIDKAELVSSFPKEYVLSASERPVGFDACRSLCPVTFFFDDGLDASSHDGAELNENQVQQLSSRLNAALSSMFARWAERTYCVAVGMGARVVPTPMQSQAIMRAMEMYSHCDCAFIVRKLNALPPGVTQVALASDVVLYHKLRRMSGVIFARPSHEKLTENYLVFGI